jgi:uncharacterized membrane protein
MQPMSRLVFGIALFGSALASNLAVTGKAIAKFEKAAAKAGQGISDRPTAKSRAVVKPNPDLLFGVCVFDAAKGPLTIRMQQPSAYWSISLYGKDGSNIALFSRRDQLPATVSIKVAENLPARTASGERAIAAGPGKSAVILRILPQDGANPAHEREALETARCTHGGKGAK